MDYWFFEKNRKTKITPNKSKRKLCNKNRILGKECIGTIKKL